MNTAEITQDEIDQLDFNQRADLLRERGAPIPDGEMYFPQEYLVEVEMKKKISSPDITWTYTWQLKDDNRGEGKDAEDKNLLAL